MLSIQLRHDIKNFLQQPSTTLVQEPRWWLEALIQYCSLSSRYYARIESEGIKDPSDINDTIQRRKRDQMKLILKERDIKKHGKSKDRIV